MAMTSSMTRSRRAEGLLHPSHPNIHRTQPLATAKTQNQPTFSPNSHRQKRQLDHSEGDFSLVVHKKARIAVEIPSRSSLHPKSAKAATNAKASLPQAAPAKNPKPKPAADAGPNPPKPSRAPPPPPVATATVATTTSKPAANGAARGKQPPALPKHKAKVVNGLKHELDRLQPPQPIETKEQGRKLRSQEASRFKSELSAYFPDYDEVIGNDPKEQHLLNLDTPLVIAKSSPSQPHNPAPLATAQGSLQPRARDTYPVRNFGDALFTKLEDAQIIDMGFLPEASRNPTDTVEDPLLDSAYEPAHKKAERLERSIRNSEKGRAQHEKDQIIRLLDGLQGPDWLRVMGVSGITESRKKTFEPARAHFIHGCQTILDKFRRWAAEEKRRKLAKERAIAEAEAAAAAEKEAEVDEEIGDSEAEEVEEEIADSDVEMVDAKDGDHDDSDADQDVEPPDFSDIDASVAKQLQEEAEAAEAKKKSTTATTRRTRWKAPPPPPPPPSHSRQQQQQQQQRVEQPETQAEFKSFFKKKYQRDAALSKSRRKGRTVLAWGHPVPDMDAADFELSVEYLDQDTLRTRARKKRLDRRAKH
ncbi:something about silencing, SAS, complex subunit 4-domain-containing protein [Lasiosphaeria ovina]|uniref:Something about silencing, SAS, complex subunit 4-domain-containing protein n=1 Tax=Lasiosphaeria ovina TaxID=92902 RepID=A0AAE0NLW0_9PEZI|nr:something about silencing, SAS, complex subunit 4-domain-containing protein [Lasiosphaeria ovina]